MKESAIERRLVTAVKKAGGLAWKFVSPGHSGVPDRIVMLPYGQIIFVELKTETGKPTPLQLQTHRQLERMGFRVRVLYGKNDVEGFIYEVQAMGIPAASLRVDPIAPQVRAFLGDGPR